MPCVGDGCDDAWWCGALQTTELNVRFAAAKTTIARFSKAPAVDPAQIAELEAHDRASKELIKESVRSVHAITRH